MATSGKTTGNLKLRSGPGMQFEPPLAFLEPDTALEVLGEDGDWLHVRVNGQEGYVGKKYVEVSAAPVAPAAPAAPAAMAKAAPAPAAKPADDEEEHTGMTKLTKAPGQSGAATAGKAHKGVEDT